jgi:D-alanyl-D-alanine carboxypeptidase
MVCTQGKRLSRRRLLSSVAPAAGLAIAASRLGVPAATFAQTATPSPERPPATLSGVLRNGLDAGLVGIALRVERGRDVVFDDVAGFSSLENKTPVEPGDRFRIASITKTFTGTVVLQQVDNGILTLDDTVTQWLNDPVVARIPSVDEITIRQLLNHTSGVYDYFADDSAFWQDAYFGEKADWTRVWTPLDLLAYAGGDRHDPSFAPGEGASYSNTGFILLGLIAERATGQAFADLLHAGITDPLELNDTFFAATEPVTGGLVDGYHLIDGELVNTTTIDLSAYFTAGGIVSTTRDLARFEGALLDGDLLQPSTLEAMLTFVPAERPGVMWGLGIAHGETPYGDSVGMGGDGPGSGSRMFRLPDEDLTVVLITNTGGDVETVDAIFSQAVQAAVETASSNG